MERYESILGWRFLLENGWQTQRWNPTCFEVLQCRESRQSFRRLTVKKSPSARKFACFWQNRIQNRSRIVAKQVNMFSKENADMLHVATLCCYFSPSVEQSSKRQGARWSSNHIPRFHLHELDRLYLPSSTGNHSWGMGIFQIIQFKDVILIVQTF